MYTFEQILARDGRLIYRTKGVSMEPMLRQNRDVIVVHVPEGRLKKYDVALYKRRGDYVLHRVIDVKDGYYLIRGDNTYSIERVPDSDVLGVLTEFQRKGKTCSVDNRLYRLYARFWNTVYPIRALGLKVRRLAVRVMRKLGLRKQQK